MQKKRVTIYDIAEALGMSASYVSRALNDHPAVSSKIRELVKDKANELNYKLDARAANLRQGFSRNIGVIVPSISQCFFAEAIAGIEKICAEHDYNVIVSQSCDSYDRESLAISRLIHQHVDCILISIAAGTHSVAQLQDIKNNSIELIQFDRCLDGIDTHKVCNNNRETAYQVTKILLTQGYKKIAFMGGPGQLSSYREQKEGFLLAMTEEDLTVPYNFVVENVLSQERASHAARTLLSLKSAPDAFVTVSDKQSISILNVANELKIRVPQQIGIFGLSNEPFSALVSPTLSSVDPRGKELGKRAAELYFTLTKSDRPENYLHQTVTGETIIRESSGGSQR